MSRSVSFSEQIEEISSAFPAVLDCATCRTPQPMKIDLLRLRAPAMETSSSTGAPHVERSAIAKHDGPGGKGSDRAARQFSRAIADVAQPAACRATLRSAAKYALRSFRCS